MKKYRDEESGEVTVVVDDLSFLYDREHFSWLQRHIRNIRIRRALGKAGKVLASDDKVRGELCRYYRIPKEKIGVIHPQNRE